ncbi:MAG TPA: hypothetical protein VKM94_14120 [Blastocatellia bacterium]|nr:hypothetical protein [Blastocatellia bacterium]
MNTFRFVYGPPVYRYYHTGQYYEVSRFAADELRQAVRYGYAEGFRAGRSDRLDRWSYGFQDSFAFEDGSYGYSGYVSFAEYQYYFREGFRRGYEDGFYGRTHYGSLNGGILSGILQTILALQSLR